MRSGRILATVFQVVFFICALLALISLGVITFYIFQEGLPIIQKVGLWNFLTGTKWQPGAEIFGIAPMIWASVISTIGAAAIGVPVGVLTAVFLAEFAPKRLADAIRPLVGLLAAIPSVVYGFFGLIVIVPFLDKTFGYGGNSMLAVILVLAVMILPTIISVCETSIRSVPKSYKEASLALGASHPETAFKVTLPAAKSGIFAGVVLGIGRAVGETMAILLVAGNTVRMPYLFDENGAFSYLFKSVRTLTANCALEMSYASGDHQKALFATAIVLFVFIMLLNVVLMLIKGKAAKSE